MRDALRRQLFIEGLQRNIAFLTIQHFAMLPGTR
jgi:hypothetical protein